MYIEGFTVELQVQQRALLKKFPSTTLGESMKALLKVKKVEDMLAHDKLYEVGWGGDESVICDGVLYFLIYSTRGGTRFGSKPYAG
ncbi:hypothetical protein IFM89_029456 [Coptis chinensis]|uniref:Uncharacterized protein n=1 Tax=Coptis chinensis TaxID=261450 RepID=A0A835HYR1_9MAGN|nr:hypothetical protein IFM89_029456 [Coptis chinensis]